RAAGVPDDADNRRIVAKARGDADLARLRVGGESQRQWRTARRSVAIEAIECELSSTKIGEASACRGDADVQRVAAVRRRRGRPGAPSARRASSGGGDEDSGEVAG